MNRAIWEGVAEAKDVCKAKSLDMDVADLRLQNLQYEKNHLVRQIRHCRDFHFDESTVQLHLDAATLSPAYISPISPLYLAYICPISAPCLPYFSQVTGLVDEATFARTAPAELCVPEQPHQHQVNRMSHELQQRQALCAQRDALLAEKAR